MSTTIEARIAPTTCAIQYPIMSSIDNRRSRNIASETTGLKCPPDTSREGVEPDQEREAEAERDRDDPPRRTSPADAETIANEPTPTSVNVPSTSARYFCIFPMANGPFWLLGGRYGVEVLRTDRLLPGWSGVVGACVEVGQPDLDEGPHCVLEPCLARGLERLLVALAHLVPATTPCFSRLSPVTSSRWILARASSPAAMPGA